MRRRRHKLIQHGGKGLRFWILLLILGTPSGVYGGFFGRVFTRGPIVPAPRVNSQAGRPMPPRLAQNGIHQESIPQVYPSPGQIHNLPTNALDPSSMFPALSRRRQHEIDQSRRTQNLAPLHSPPAPVHQTPAPVHQTPAPAAAPHDILRTSTPIERLQELANHQSRPLGAQQHAGAGSQNGVPPKPARQFSETERTKIQENYKHQQEEEKRTREEKKLQRRPKSAPKPMVLPPSIGESRIESHDHLLKGTPVPKGPAQAPIRRSTHDQLDKIEPLIPHDHGGHAAGDHRGSPVHNAATRPFNPILDTHSIRLPGGSHSQRAGPSTASRPSAQGQSNPRSSAQSLASSKAMNTTPSPAHLSALATAHGFPASIAHDPAIALLDHGWTAHHTPVSSRPVRANSPPGPSVHQPPQLGLAPDARKAALSSANARLTTAFERRPGGSRDPNATAPSASKTVTHDSSGRPVPPVPARQDLHLRPLSDHLKDLNVKDRGKGPAVGSSHPLTNHNSPQSSSHPHGSDVASTSHHQTHMESLSSGHQNHDGPSSSIAHHPPTNTEPKPELPRNMRRHPSLPDSHGLPSHPQPPGGQFNQLRHKVLDYHDPRLHQAEPKFVEHHQFIDPKSDHPIAQEKKYADHFSKQEPPRGIGRFGTPKTPENRLRNPVETVRPVVKSKPGYVPGQEEIQARQAERQRRREEKAAQRQVPAHPAAETAHGPGHGPSSTPTGPKPNHTPNLRTPAQRGEPVPGTARRSESEIVKDGRRTESMWKSINKAAANPLHTPTGPHSPRGPINGQSVHPEAAGPSGLAKQPSVGSHSPRSANHGQPAHPEAAGQLAPSKQASTGPHSPRSPTHGQSGHQATAGSLGPSKQLPNGPHSPHGATPGQPARPEPAGPTGPSKQSPKHSLHASPSAPAPEDRLPAHPKFNTHIQTVENLKKEWDGRRGYVPDHNTDWSKPGVKWKIGRREERGPPPSPTGSSSDSSNHHDMPPGSSRVRSQPSSPTAPPSSSVPQGSSAADKGKGKMRPPSPEHTPKHQGAPPGGPGHTNGSAPHAPKTPSRLDGDPGTSSAHAQRGQQLSHQGTPPATTSHSPPPSPHVSAPQKQPAPPPHPTTPPAHEIPRLHYPPLPGLEKKKGVVSKMKGWFKKGQ